MREAKGRPTPLRQLAMLLPIAGGLKDPEPEPDALINEEEQLRKSVLAQLAKAGLRARSREAEDTE